MKTGHATLHVIGALVFVLTIGILCGCSGSSGANKHPAGETVEFGSVSMMIDNPTESVIYVKEDDDGGYSDDIALLKVPLTITANEAWSGRLENFVPMVKDEEQKECELYDYKDTFPEELTLAKGESFTGNIYLYWHYAYQGEGMSFSLDIEKGPTGVKYKENDRSIEWEFNYSRDIREVNKKTALKQLPYVKVSANVYFRQLTTRDDGTGLVLFSFEKNDDDWGGLDCEAEVSKEVAEALDGAKVDDEVKVTGKIGNITEELYSGALIGYKTLCLYDIAVEMD